MKLSRWFSVLAFLASVNAWGDQAADIENYLKHQRDEDKLGAGVAVVVIEQGNSRFITLGSANVATSEALTRQHAMEIGSISKTFTSLMLADASTRSKLSLDASIAPLLPTDTVTQDNRLASVTFRHLASHRAGLPRVPSNLRPANMMDPYADYDKSALFSYLQEFRQTREPGSLVEYSNLGSGLLGTLLEMVYQKPYGDILDEIAEPLKIKDAFINEPKGQKTASPHFNATNLAPRWHFDALAGAGAINASIEDMHAYLLANLNPSGTLQEAIELTHKPVADMAPGLQIGLGWLIQSTPDKRYWWHNGGTGGSRSFMGFDKKEQRGIVILANSTTNFDALGHAYLAGTLASFIENESAALQLNEPQLQRLVGEYALAPGFSITISREGGQLYAQATGQEKFAIFARSETEFFLKVIDASLHFSLDEKGISESLELHQNGQKTKGKKIQ